MLQIPLWKPVCSSSLVVWPPALLLAMPNVFYTRVERHNDAVAEIEAAARRPNELAGRCRGWPSFLPSNLVNLGLDLRGGAHLLAEVQVDDVYADRMDAFWPEVRDALRDERDTVGTDPPAALAAGRVARADLRARGPGRGHGRDARPGAPGQFA